MELRTLRQAQDAAQDAEFHNGRNLLLFSFKLRCGCH
jgi:hypothetical protein